MTKNSAWKKAARAYQHEHPGTTLHEAMRAVTPKAAVPTTDHTTVHDPSTVAEASGALLPAHAASGEGFGSLDELYDCDPGVMMERMYANQWKGWAGPFEARVKRVISARQGITTPDLIEALQLPATTAEEAAAARKTLLRHGGLSRLSDDPTTAGVIYDGAADTWHAVNYW